MNNDINNEEYRYYNKESNGTSLFINNDALYNQGEEFYNVIEKRLRTVLDKMKTLENNCEWKGLSHDKFFSKMDLSIMQMTKYSNILEKYGIFLEKVTSEFDMKKSIVKKDFQSNIDVIVGYTEGVDK